MSFGEAADVRTQFSFALVRVYLERRYCCATTIGDGGTLLVGSRYGADR